MEPAHRTFAVAAAIGSIMVVVAVYILIDAFTRFVPDFDISNIAAVAVAVLLSLTACILRLMCVEPACSRTVSHRRLVNKA